MTHLTPEEVEMIEREAWEVWEKDQKTNPTPVNPHAFVYGYRIAATQLKEERERAGKLMEALEELVQLKEWKDKNGKDEHYTNAQPLAWAKAKSLL